ncbi:MAG TPA: secondary thiamine-phosphate synthase enzyme YjbQ [Spirochaetota bacterium]|nr:secondary thiamine-phosphate synthase enzyme YjbQ [Spirochaetota bacterium]HOM08547.1 secondary thiamine-phosphate synthase enzyme YjbQ [Spirochaetota bacterium]HPP48366.1 secondary thiamine-phosphate synthase enzyme YjbQ [Spirochaetota bacterium]
MVTFQLQTTRKEEFIDITAKVAEAVAKENVKSGLCCVYIPHTTAAVTINENADPTVPKDILMGLSHLKLESLHFAHVEGNSPAHIKSSVIGCSTIIIVENNCLQLGTWQGIFFCEFDGPRTRKVMVQCIGT